MSHECPCCGHWVQGEEPLPEAEQESLRQYVAHLADKAKERKTDALAASQSRVKRLEAALRRTTEDLRAIYGNLYPLVREAESALTNDAGEGA